MLKVDKKKVEDSFAEIIVRFGVREQVFEKIRGTVALK